MSFFFYNPETLDIFIFISIRNIFPNRLPFKDIKDIGQRFPKNVVYLSKIKPKF